MKSRNEPYQYQIAALNFYKNTGAPVSFTKRLVCLTDPNGGQLLRGKIQDWPIVETFVHEGLHSYIRGVLFAENNSSSCTDYSEAVRAKGWGDLLFQCFAPSYDSSGPYQGYACSASISSLIFPWTETWKWNRWPSISQIRRCVQKLLSSYESTVHLIAFLHHQKIPFAFHKHSKAFYLRTSNSDSLSLLARYLESTPNDYFAPRQNNKRFSSVFPWIELDAEIIPFMSDPEDPYFIIT